MKISRLGITEPAHMRGLQMHRCGFTVPSKSLFLKNRNCSRFALYEIDGIKVCGQHAGQIALNHLLDNNE